MASQGLVALLTDAKNNITRSSLETEQLGTIYQAQNVILEDLMHSIPETSELQNELDDANDTLNELDQQIAAYQTFLFDLLNQEPPKQRSPGDILKSVLMNYLSTLYQSTMESIEKGSTEVSILKIMELEDQIAAFVDAMSDQGLFPETKDAQDLRLKKRQEHTLKTIEYLKKLKSQKEAEFVV